MAKGTIVINSERCKGCTLCTTVCPYSLIVMDEGIINAKGYHPAKLDPSRGDCTGCALCATICPDACITVFRIQKAAV